MAIQLQRYAQNRGHFGGGVGPSTCKTFVRGQRLSSKLKLFKPVWKGCPNYDVLACLDALGLEHFAEGALALLGDETVLVHLLLLSPPHTDAPALSPRPTTANCTTSSSE